MTNGSHFTKKKERDIEDSPELTAQLEARASEIVEVVNEKGGREKVIKRA